MQVRFATVLCADFARTAPPDPHNGQKHDADAAVAARGAAHARLEAIIAAHGGAIQKSNDAGMVALFGGTRASDRDPAQAVRAAFVMQSSFRDSLSGQPEGLRIGI